MINEGTTRGEFKGLLNTLSKPIIKISSRVFAITYEIKISFSFNSILRCRSPLEINEKEI